MANNSPFCPQCGKHAKNHDDVVCDFRYLNGSGWTPGYKELCTCGICSRPECLDPNDEV